MSHTVRFERELPEPLLAMVAKDRSAIADEVKQAAVVDWVRMHRISWRKGAELLGYVATIHRRERVELSISK
ncbi:MAG: hypothetical protein ACHBNF_21050 [Chromatiales bacterium]